MELGKSDISADERDILLAHLNDESENDEVRIAVVNALSGQANPDTVRAFATVATTTEALQVRQAAASALIRLMEPLASGS